MTQQITVLFDWLWFPILEMYIYTGVHTVSLTG